MARRWISSGQPVTNHDLSAGGISRTLTTEGYGHALEQCEDVKSECCGRLLHRHVSAADVGLLLKPPRFGGAKSGCKRSRQSGLDIAKSVISESTACVDNDGKVVIRRQLKRRYVLAFAPGSCSTLHWSASRPVYLVTPLVTHELQALGPYRAVDAAGLRQALRQTAEERCGRRRGHL